MESKLRKVLLVLGFTLLFSSQAKATFFDTEYQDVPLEDCLIAIENGFIVYKYADPEFANIAAIHKGGFFVFWTSTQKQQYQCGKMPKE